MSLEDIFSLADDSAPKELAVCLKADVHGTCEAVVDSLEKLSTDAVKLKVLSSGVGGVTENDVMLARASEAIIVGFNVRPDGAARRMAEDQGVEIRSYRIIYELIDDVRAAMAGPYSLSPRKFLAWSIGLQHVIVPSVDAVLSHNR